ncbi:MAG: hypothetical protein AAF466_05690 [Bacteroidota bacterium]
MELYAKVLQQKHGEQIQSESLKRVSVHQNLEYEIGSFQTSKDASFSTMSIWVNENNSEKRILEAVYKNAASDGEVDLSDISKARSLWMELCNSHKANELVKQLYTYDAIYYNRGRILRGYDQLSKEYGYMNNPSYSLELHPLLVQPVNESTVFEMGKCSGSYNLPYLLIWKKQDDGSWKIYMDSNF